VLHVYAEADEATRAAIRDAYTAPEIRGRAAHLRRVVDLTPGVDYALARAHQLIEQSRRRLAELPPSPSHTALDALTAFVLERNW
jgi:geranylgeranyl pyrophosphate synthase